MTSIFSIDNFSGDIPNAITKKIGEWRRQILTADVEDDIKYNIALDIQQWANVRRFLELFNSNLIIIMCHYPL